MPYPLSVDSGADNTIETAVTGQFGNPGINYAQALMLSAITTKSYPVTITYMECLVTALNATHPTLELGIYSWDGAGGGTLLSSGIVVPSATGFAPVTLAIPVTLSPRTRYYLAYLNRASGDAATYVAMVATEPSSILAAAILNGQAVMPTTLSGLSTSGAVCIGVRGWS